MPIFLHLPAEMVVICNDVDIEAAIVIELDLERFNCFCDFDKMQPYQLFIAACQLPRLWLLLQRVKLNCKRKEKSIGDRNCANPVLIIPLGRVLRELPKFSHVKKKHLVQYLQLVIGAICSWMSESQDCQPRDCPHLVAGNPELGNPEHIRIAPHSSFSVNYHSSKQF